MKPGASYMPEMLYQLSYMQSIIYLFKPQSTASLSSGTVSLCSWHGSEAGSGQAMTVVTPTFLSFPTPLPVKEGT